MTFSNLQEKLFIDTLNRTMVEPRRRCFSLPALDHKKKALGGIFAVTIVSAQNLAKPDHRESRAYSSSSSGEKLANGDGGSSHGKSNGSSGGSSNGTHHGSSHGGSGGSTTKRSEKLRFVEISCEDLTRRTGMQSGPFPHVWNETYDMVLHDNVGNVHIHVYEQGLNNVKYDFLGSCEIKVATQLSCIIITLSLHFLLLSILTRKAQDEL